MIESTLLTPDDLIIKAKIADRANIKTLKGKKTWNDKFLNGLIKQFGSFKKFIEKVDFDIAVGIIYDKDKRIKTCTLCGLEMPIGAMLSVHRKTCISRKRNRWRNQS